MMSKQLQQYDTCMSQSREKIYTSQN